MKYILIFIHFFMIASCQEKNKIVKSENMIAKFNYPEDIELLEKNGYVCDSLKLKKFEFNLKVLFANTNFTLFKYDERTRLLNDKKNSLWLVFKASEPHNFNFKKTDYKNLYGLFNIYVLDENLMPLFSFNKNLIKKYRLNNELKVTQSIEISFNNKNIIHDIDIIDYKGILEIVNELKNSKYENIGVWVDEFFYTEPPIWTDL